MRPSCLNWVTVKMFFKGGVVGILLAPIFTQDGIWYAEACSRNIFPCDFKPYYVKVSITLENFQDTIIFIIRKNIYLTKLLEVLHGMLLVWLQ